MGVIEDFASEYERQFDFWESAARTAHSILEAELDSSGLRAIVTSRAKSVDRLVDKLRGRDRERKYSSVAAVRADIVDLAGVRVALYFPGQLDEAERIIRSALLVQHSKRFPAGSSERIRADSEISHGGGDVVALDPPHRHRFSGYGARHFRATIPKSSLRPGQERFATALIEVQVASVLMHAWSEVEHDLVYKPLEGRLSTSEYALLDQLNGLVLAGEIALEQLQKAGDMRVGAASTRFRDHFELAEFLRNRLSTLEVALTDATLGRVDVLFDFLAEQDLATADAVGPYLDRLEADIERRPVAAQLADLMLSENETLYAAYQRAMAASRHVSNSRLADALANGEKARTTAVGEFIAAWITLETLFRDLGLREGRYSSVPSLIRELERRGLVSAGQVAELNAIRSLRNDVVHGNGREVPADRLTGAARWLHDLTQSIERSARGEET